jgi:ubiquitin thioesterase protein OTUB1
MPDVDLKQYCATEIEPSVCELDHIGLSALVEVLLKPIGVAIEVSYLDRSPGEEVNIHRIEPVGFAPQDMRTIRLLYRP